MNAYKKETNKINFYGLYFDDRRKITTYIYTGLYEKIGSKTIYNFHVQNYIAMKSLQLCLI